MEARTIYNNTAFQTYPAEEKLRYECKQALKSRIFRGYYLERRYEEAIAAYRDIVVLQKAEKELEQLLLEVKCKFSMYYANINKDKIWIGITNDAAVSKNQDSLNTSIWTNLDNVAFGQYWFSIKTVKFVNNELLIKLKTVRPVEAELIRPYRRPTKSTISKGDYERSDETMKSFLNDAAAREEYSDLLELTNEGAPDVSFGDFLKLFQSWALSVKLSTYNFLAHDVNQKNIVEVLRFIGLCIVSLLAALVVGVKHLGIYSLRLIFEVSRLVHVLTPVALKIIDVITKTIGGFYILLSMMWRDLFGKRIEKRESAILEPITSSRTPYASIEYKRPMLSRKFDYDSRFNSQYSLNRYKSYDTKYQ